MPSQRTNVSIWDMVEKEFREPRQEHKLRKSPGDKKQSSGDRRRDKKRKEFPESQGSQAAALVPIGKPTTPKRPRAPSTPGEDAMGHVRGALDALVISGNGTAASRNNKNNGRGGLSKR